MGHRRSHLISVYVTPEVGQALRAAATASNDSASGYVSALVAQHVAARKAVGSDADPILSTLRYLSVGMDAALDHLDVKLRPTVRKVHATRFGGSSDAR